MILDDLLRIPPGEIRVWPAANPFEMLSLWGHGSLAEAWEFRIVAQRWQSLPSLPAIMEEVIRNLAEKALALWPHWYTDTGLELEDGYTGLEHVERIENFINRLTQTRREIIKTWLIRAAVLCSSQRLPLPREFSLAVQASQLALALHCQRLFFVFGVEAETPAEGRLLGFVKMVEWLMNQTGASIAVVIPKSLATHAELESILYQADSLPPPLLDVYYPKAIEETKYTIWPMQGIPHPLSPGEQKLAQGLSQDRELANLFQFNQPINTVRNHRYLVDLLWREGMLVVEVDGYRNHGNRMAFIQDRQRDYELTISGYTVLRIPHDEIMENTVMALEKIRDVVNYCKKSKPTERNVQ